MDMEYVGIYLFGRNLERLDWPVLVGFFRGLQMRVLWMALV